MKHIKDFVLKYISKRDSIHKALLQHNSILEIGPFTTPFIMGEKVKYFDVLTIEGLLERAAKIDYPFINAPSKIDYCSPTGDLSIVNEKFDAVFSSNCIEHQPDLISHLQNVSRILCDNGKYYLFIPDKRYTFDYFKNISTIANIIEAYEEKRTGPSIATVIIASTYHTSNITYKHWLGQHGLLEIKTEKIKKAIEQYRSSKGNYIDLHTWFFTPQSFAEIIKLLNQCGYVDFSIEYIADTPPTQAEFCVILKKEPFSNREYKEVPLDKTTHILAYCALIYLFFNDKFCK